jgi:hypothetical protein
MGAQVVNNMGTNYTLYYNILDFYKVVLTNHPSLNFVSQGDMFSIDTKEFPAYPLGNFTINDALFLEKELIYTCQLTIADKVKNKNNESVGSANLQTVPFEGTDDVVDIHANTLSIVNDIVSFTRTGVQAFEIQGDPKAIPFKDNFDNGLAGWVVTFNLKVFNSADTCLFNLYP